MFKNKNRRKELLVVTLIGARIAPVEIISRIES